MIYYRYKERIEMKKYSAVVKDVETGEMHVLEKKEYRNLADFRHDIHANGFRVVRNVIAESERFNWIMNNTNSESWHWKQKTGITTKEL
jgi:hypothetical protein